jgi:hypothetical protein
MNFVSMSYAIILRRPAIYVGATNVGATNVGFERVQGGSGMVVGIKRGRMF